MTITLPEDLAWALNQLGFAWPDSDEDKLNRWVRPGQPSPPR